MLGVGPGGEKMLLPYWLPLPAGFKRCQCKELKRADDDTEGEDDFIEVGSELGGAIG